MKPVDFVSTPYKKLTKSFAAGLNKFLSIRRAQILTESGRIVGAVRYPCKCWYVPVGSKDPRKK